MMKKNVLTILGVALMGLWLVAPAQALSLSFSGKPESFAKLVEKVSPAVVNINTTKTVASHPLLGIDPFFDQYFKEQYKNHPGAQQKKQNYGLGSGFIVSEDGKILTNNHVIRGADDIYVTLENGDQVRARVLGKDAKLDLAVLQLEKSGKYPYVEFGNSSEMRIGDWVIAMGNPLGLGKTVTAGIISAKERNIKMGPYDNFIQTDASINPGNSGGPLFNTDGKVIGVNTAIIGGAQGIGFAIPVNLAKNVYSQIIKTGRVQRGWMGISLVALNQEEAKKRTGSKKLTTYVVEVVQGGPASKAGLKAEDILVEIDGKKIDNTDAVPRLIATKLPGTQVDIKYLRRGKTYDTKVILGDLDNPHKSFVFPVNNNQTKQDIIGIDVRNIESSDRLPVKSGAYVSRVHPNTIASAVGIQKGDVIVKVNKQEIADTKSFGKALSKINSGDLVSLKVLRKNALMHFAFRK